MVFTGLRKNFLHGPFLVRNPRVTARFTNIIMPSYLAIRQWTWGTVRRHYERERYYLSVVAIYHNFLFRYNLFRQTPNIVYLQTLQKQNLPQKIHVSWSCCILNQIIEIADKITLSHNRHAGITTLRRLVSIRKMGRGRNNVEFEWSIDLLSDLRTFLGKDLNPNRQSELFNSILFNSSVYSMKHSKTFEGFLIMFLSHCTQY